MQKISNFQKKNPIEYFYTTALIISISVAIMQFTRFLFIALSRITFPFTLEWMEGGSFVQVSRILNRQALYVRPSFDFIPQIYPPVYFYVSALVSKVLGNSFLSLRLVSILSTLGILFLIFSLVYEHSGSTLGGILASSLFCATYELTGYWFDIARVDSLALALLLLAAYFLLKDKLWASILGGVFLALSCFTKQTMLIAAGIFIIYCLFSLHKKNLIFLATAIITFLSGTLILDLLHSGWYSYYIFHLPGQHSVISDANKLITSTNTILFVEIIKPLFFSVIVGGGYLMLFPEKIILYNDNNLLNKEKVREVWSKRGVWVLVITSSLLALGSFVFLAGLPSNADKSVLGPYSFSRLFLMTGPVVATGLLFTFAVRMRQNPILNTLIANKLFSKVFTIPLILLSYIIFLGFMIIIITNLKPDFIDGLTIAYLQRLLPYLAGPLIILILSGTVWILLWSPVNTGTWLFFLLLGFGMTAISWVGRLNPGGYYNVLMPAYAGISILFGLGIGNLLETLKHKKTTSKYVLSIIALLFSSVQMGNLLSSPTPQIPTQSDKEAGVELVNRLKACQGDVYIPFHTYLAELAGKKGYAGFIEISEVKGIYGKRSDPLWDEVLKQIQHKLDTQSFAVVIQDNRRFRDAISPNYLEAGQIFKNELVFWPVTGWKVRPDFFLQSNYGESCFFEIE